MTLFNDFVRLMTAKILLTTKYDGKEGRLSGAEATDILNILPKAHIIVNDALIGDKPVETHPDDLIHVPSPPFQTCWIEVPRRGAIFSKGEGGINAQYYGMLLHEAAPHRYLYAILKNGKSLKDEYEICVGMINMAMPHKNPSSEYAIIQAFLQPFSMAYSMGTQRANVHIKLRRNGKNEHHKIRHIVHIVAKTKGSREALESTMNIDWSHRWAVRGHWRELPEGKLGKDRSGEYVVRGFTWVEDHVKGPEDKPYIEKTRVIDKEFFKQEGDK
jgi:hypothetical protein